MDCHDRFLLRSTVRVHRTPSMWGVAVLAMCILVEIHRIRGTIRRHWPVTERANRRVPGGASALGRGCPKMFTAPPHHEHVRFTPGKLGNYSAGLSRACRSRREGFERKMSLTMLSEGRRQGEQTTHSRRRLRGTNRSVSPAPLGRQGPKEFTSCSSRSRVVVLSRLRTYVLGASVQSSSLPVNGGLHGDCVVVLVRAWCSCIVFCCYCGSSRTSRSA